MRGSSEKSLAPVEAHLDGASRRQFLKGAAAAVTATSIGASKAIPATSQAKTISHGEFSVTMLSDGHLTIPTRFLARNTSEDDIKTTIGLTGNLVTPPCNITLVRTPSETILIDVGAGPHYMPGAGKLAENMEAAGIERKSISKVVLTHAHPDHLWGLLDDFDNSPMFPNASYVMSTAEFEFWMAKDAVAHLPEDHRNFVAGAQRNLTSIGDRLHLIAPGADIASGIRAIDTAGHTAGHISIEIASGNEIALVLADTLMHPIISFAHPEWSPAADHHDPDQAIATRKRLLGRLANDKSLAIGFHLPFPGIGRVEARGSAYKFVPTT